MGGPTAMGTWGCCDPLPFKPFLAVAAEQLEAGGQVGGS